MLEGEYTSGSVNTCQAPVDRSPNLPPRTARAAEVAYDAVADSGACRQGEDGHKYFACSFSAKKSTEAAPDRANDVRAAIAPAARWDASAVRWL
jgi:hypothetical protein